VQARLGEIAILRAIGFQSAPVVVSAVLETLLLATLGGVLGAAVAWSLFDDFTGSTFGAGLGALSFNFDMSATVLWTGLEWALAIGSRSSVWGNYATDTGIAVQSRWLRRLLHATSRADPTATASSMSPLRSVGFANRTLSHSETNVGGSNRSQH